MRQRGGAVSRAAARGDRAPESLCVPDLPRALLVDTFTPASLVEAQQLGCESLNVGLKGLEAAHVQAIHSAGLRMMVYTVNTREVAAQLASWGVGGVFTDRPDLLQVHPA